MAEQRRGNGGREALAESIAGSITSASSSGAIYKRDTRMDVPFCIVWVENYFFQRKMAQSPASIWVSRLVPMFSTVPSRLTICTSFSKMME